ncbi:hypothetical protein WQE_00090 [Paraburkholderia hospita]|uniref:DUF2946 domain-containing protein n=1 Tax=Paraburkholderia hospita TaxID=169430 RepID=A0ABN0FWE7_9BURK|nr:DUF2946 domain-containing protein [Paraburkholderia hospita]EIN03214.1 hypothetical protein WQE_00090 [Paraburkholderia hospita]OUL77152.1 hypothetical protein CA602_33340 [Paraburkholderia hospita]
MRSRFFRLTGSFLGLLAILIATLAPTVSHSLAMLHGQSDAHCSMPSMQHEASYGSPNAHWPISDGEACGYCSLLAHMPAVIAPRLVFSQIVQVVLHQRATRFESVQLIELRTPGQPRAPPFLYF